MSDELVTPENLSNELLLSIFDAAFMDASLDDDGTLRVKEKVRCLVMPSEAKDRIRLVCIFGFKPESSEQQRLECVNKINSEYIIVRAISGPRDSLIFDYDILVKGGVTKKNIVLSTKRFLSIPPDAIDEHAADLVE